MMLIPALIMTVGLGQLLPHDRPTFKPLDVPLSATTARRCFDMARELAGQDDGRLWGVRLDAPILLVDPRNRRAIASHPDAEGQLQHLRETYVGTFPVKETVAGTVRSWAGVEWVMLPWPLPKDDRELRLMLAHEMWHRVQRRIGLPWCSPANSHLDTRDGRVWLQLEWRALAKALQTSGCPHKQAITDALVFRAHRRSLYADCAEGERQMEMHEGLAEYTGVRLAGRSDADARELALRDLESAAQWPSFCASFAYASGPAYGLLLEAHAPDWRRALTSGGDLGQILRQAAEIDMPTGVATEAARRAHAYDGAVLMSTEDRRAEQCAAQLAAFSARFIHGPRLVLPVRDMQLQFDPRRIHAFAKHGRVYMRIRISDAWGTLDVSEHGALIADDWSQIIVSAPRHPVGPRLRGDGWTLQLDETWRLLPGAREGDYALIERD